MCYQLPRASIWQQQGDPPLYCCFSRILLKTKLVKHPKFRGKNIIPMPKTLFTSSCCLVPKTLFTSSCSLGTPSDTNTNNGGKQFKDVKNLSQINAGCRKSSMPYHEQTWHKDLCSFSKTRQPETRTNIFRNKVTWNFVKVLAMLHNRKESDITFRESSTYMT